LRNTFTSLRISDLDRLAAFSSRYGLGLRSKTALKKSLQAGRFRNLLFYRKTAGICDATHRFCQRFKNSRDRTAKHMIQAAHSGKQHLVEASIGSATPN
jgi:hypothetical protein